MPKVCQKIFEKLMSKNSSEKGLKNYQFWPVIMAKKLNVIVRKNRSNSFIVHWELPQIFKNGKWGDDLIENWNSSLVTFCNELIFGFCNKVNAEENWHLRTSYYDKAAFPSWLLKMAELIQVFYLLGWCLNCPLNNAQWVEKFEFRTRKNWRK